MIDEDMIYGQRGSSRVWIEAGLEGGPPAAREEPGGRGAPADLGFTPNEEREKDLRVLHALCDDGTSPFAGGLKDAEREAFESMRDALESPNRRYETLTPRQREWATRRAADLEIDLQTPAERNASVPRGREVESKAAQLGLPLAPPGRTVGQAADAGWLPEQPATRAARAAQPRPQPLRGSK